MQRAIMGYHASSNLGDALQSYAMLQLVRGGEYQSVSLVDRDDIGSFVPAQETVLVMNGWFLHRPDRFFLSPNVAPAMIGVHITPARPRYSRYPPFADIVRECPSVQAVFRQAAPVGARDLYTLAALQQIGIESYFAGCPTLSIQPKGLASDGSVVAVDVPKPVCDVLERRLKKPIVRITSRSQSSWMSVSELRRDVDPFLDMLERAEIVITTRLHAALPARALGVHTVFAPADPTDPRFSGLADFLAVTVSLRELGQSPLSLFSADRWTAAKQAAQQVEIMKAAVDCAFDPALERQHAGGSDSGLLTELERAALAYDRERIYERIHAMTESRSWRYTAWLRRLRR